MTAFQMPPPPPGPDQTADGPLVSTVDVLVRDAAERLVEGVELRDDGDDHYLRGVVAPYGESYDAGEFVETFAPGVFAKSIRQRGDRIALTEQHERNRFPVGLPTQWQETADGLVGVFRFAPTDRGREALELTRTGFLTGLSVGFRPLRNRTSEHGGRPHVERVEAALDHVGLVHAPAYAQAKVLEARDVDPDELDFDPDSPLTAPRLARWRARLGLRG